MSILFDHWFEDEWRDPPFPGAGIGMFDHWFENPPPKLPEASLGLLDHWFENCDSSIYTERSYR